MRTAKSKICCREIHAIMVLALGLIASIANADFTFGTPTNLGPPVNDSYGVRGMCISRDGLSLYFSSNRPGGYGGYDLWVATRETTDDNWGDPVNLGQPANTVYDVWDPSISSDGLSLYFADGFYGPFIPGGYGNMDLWVATRNTTSEPFGAPVNLGPTLNNGGPNEWPSISADGLSLYCSGWFPGTLGLCDLWVSTRTSTDEDWQDPVNLRNVSSPYGDGAPDISADGLTLFFISTRPRGFSSIDNFELWMTTRRRTSEPFGEPVKLPPHVNTEPYSALFPNLSSDGSTLYFCSNRPGGCGDSDIWQVPIIPIVDFNNDGKADIHDLLRLIESWGQNDPSVDMAPPPFGDGIVDEKDLEVLMSYWGQEIFNPALIAHWKLDETEGVIAADSARVSDGVLVGNPTWQPAGGKLGGALQLDGVGDCVTTEFVRDPSEGPFSVFAWVKGGAPGQVIVSQVNGANWLMAGASDGGLSTELKSSGRTGKTLKSAASVTAGAWHRVGFVWDGSNRILYVDDIEVARDAQTTLVGTYAGLHVGAGSTLAPGTFWSGLIDDVRIYNSAVNP